MRIWTLGNSVFGEAPQAGVVVLRAKNGYSVAYAVNKGIFLLPFQKGIQWSGGSAVFMKNPATPVDSTLEPQEDDSPKESPVKYNPPYPDLTPKKEKQKAKKPLNKDALEAPAAYNPDPFSHKKNPDSKPGEAFTFTGPADGAMPEAERKRKLKNQQDYDETYPASWPVEDESDPFARKPEKKHPHQTKDGY